MNPTEAELKNAWFNNRQGLNNREGARNSLQTYQKPNKFFH